MSNKTAWDAVDKNWRIGVEGIFAQLQAIFTGYNVTIDAPTGKAFDPEKHEALGNEAVADAASHNTIIKVVQTGFVRKGSSGDVVIRPARVIVGHFSE